jgi:hypothetical protein
MRLAPDSVCYFFQNWNFQVLLILTSVPMSTVCQLRWVWSQKAEAKVSEGSSQFTKRKLKTNLLT